VPASDIEHVPRTNRNERDEIWTLVLIEMFAGASDRYVRCAGGCHRSGL